MSTFEYIRLKSLATILRPLITSITGIPKSQASSTIQIPSRDPNRTIKAHVYLPPSNAPTPTTSSPSPVLINFHGSGFVMPLHGSDDVFCHQVSQETGHIVLDVQYRLAPEHPFPAALEDAEDVVKYVLSHPEQYDTTHLSLSGFSAGGNIALSISSVTPVFPKGTFQAVLAFYPVTTFAVPASEKSAPESGGHPIPDFMSRLFDSCYTFGSGVDRENPRLSPLYANPVDFPQRVLVVSCGYDTLCGEAEELAEKLRDGKRKVTQRRMERCDHAWDKAVKEGSYEEEMRGLAYGDAVGLLKGVL